MRTFSVALTGRLRAAEGKARTEQKFICAKMADPYANVLLWSAMWQNTIGAGDSPVPIPLLWDPPILHRLY